MSAPLTYPMKLALRDIAANEPPRNVNGGWVDTHRYGIQFVSVIALKRRGLAETDLWYARLTDAGRSAAAELKGDGA